ncbi:hypothetical protein WNZ14_22140 [Hoeflea sp. AS60]|uniref:hypothetical protein n=1 Tax=Hoeflea sp. AS60 TaxID=3135780 RepID=UPI0031790D10
MDTKYIASEVCRELVSALKQTEGLRYIAAACGRSPQTIRQYMASPESTSFRKAPFEVTDEMIKLIISYEVLRPDSSHWETREGEGWRVLLPNRTPFVCRTYLIALEVADRFRTSPTPLPGSSLDYVTISEEARLRHQWRQVFFGGRVPRQELADLAGTDIYNVAWDGREHPTRCIWPTHEQVMYAMATDAGMETLGVAA